VAGWSAPPVVRLGLMGFWEPTHPIIMDVPELHIARIVLNLSLICQSVVQESSTKRTFA
jgi:hypothetical protein